MDKILVLNGKISDIPIIEKAKEMGFYVITTGNKPELPGHVVSDEYILEDYSDMQAVLRIVQKNDIKGVVSCSNDLGVITASYVAEKMNWSGHDTYENSLLMHHKDKFKKYCKEKGIPSPQSEIFTDAGECLEYCLKAQYPIIVKANDLVAGRGIRRIDDVREAKEAVEYAFQMSKDKHILVEPFIEGIQQSIVVFLVNKRIVQTSSSNIYCWKNPYLVQAETYPAENFELVKHTLHKIIHDMADDLDLVDGIFSFQYIVRNGKPYIIEMMRRNFGNEALLLADVRTGFPWEEAYIRASLGMDCSGLKCAEPKAEFVGHYGSMADCNGILKKYIVDPEIEKRLFKRTTIFKQGDSISDYKEDKIELLYFEYENMDEMNRDIVTYNERIKIEIG